MINQILLEKRIKSFPIFGDLIKIFLKGADSLGNR